MFKKLSAWARQVKDGVADVADWFVDEILSPIGGFLAKAILALGVLLLGALVLVLAFGAVVASAALVMCIPAALVWLLYTFVLAPALHWPAISFLVVWAGLIVIHILGAANHSVSKG